MALKHLILPSIALGAALWGWASVSGAPDPTPLETTPPSVAKAVPPSGDARAAIRRSLEILEKEGVAWFEGRTQVQDGGDGCVSCHQVPYGVWGLQAAERVGLVNEPDTVSDLTRRALEFVQRPEKARTMSWVPMVLATDADVSLESDFVEFLTEQQTREGYWEARGQFPRQKRDLDETNAVASMWTILALAPLVATEAPEAPTTSAANDSVARANAWLDAIGEGKSTEWLLLRAMTLAATGENERADKLREELVLQQNEDGGWSWLPGQESDALSTGQVLYGLHEQGDPASDRERRAIERGVEYLTQQQGPNGLWTVPSALTSQEQSADRDYIYDYWGTAWATIGLSQALESTPEARNKPVSES